jgi:porin
MSKQGEGMTKRNSLKHHSRLRWLLSAVCLGAAIPAWAQSGAATDTQDCHLYDRFITRGSESPIISTCETLSPDLFGLRPEMVDRGWLLMGYYSASETYDLRGQEARPQQYNGQRPSFSGTFSSILTYDLSRLGWGKDAQMTVEVNSWRNTYANGGINDEVAVAQLSVQQQFADGRVRVQYGYYGMLGQFYGLFLGTSTASSALGPNSIIPNLVGMSTYKPAPGVDVRVYSKSGRFYNHFGVSRSQSPDGFLADSKANGSGLKWSVDGAKPIYVNEIGYRVAPSADSRMTWIRQGVIYNRSRYFDYRAQADQSINRGFYLVGDHQFWQPDKGTPYRGWYFNLKTNYTPPERSVYTADYAATLYSLAPFASRPGDMFSLGYTYNKISKDAQRYMIDRGYDAVDYSTTASASYALRATRGIYWTNTLSYTRNPVFTSRHPDALTLQTQMTFSF